MREPVPTLGAIIAPDETGSGALTDQAEEGDRVHEERSDLPGVPVDHGTVSSASPTLTAVQARHLLMIGLIGFSLAVFVIAELRSAPHGGSGSSDLRGVIYTEVLRRNHLMGPIAYDAMPPVGGDHAALWQNCGFYEAPIPVEAAVHSLEHGAVWVTYASDLSSAEAGLLRQMSGLEPKMLVSPWEASLPTTLVASAWGTRLGVMSASDPELELFVRRFVGSLRSPEHDEPCTGGRG